MYLEEEYKKNAIKKLIPYLSEFPQIVKIVETNADRYQYIENILWELANSFKLDNARGKFLEILANNENAKILYSDNIKPYDAFTYGSLWKAEDDNMGLTINPQAYGTGHFYSQKGYLMGKPTSASEDKTIRGVKAQIIKNNTDGTIEDFIEAVKNYFNANEVKVLESYPLCCSLIIKGSNVEINNIDNKNIVKEFMPVTVSLNNLYVSDYKYNIYQLGNNTSYGNSRFVRDVSEYAMEYDTHSEAIILNSEHKEYIKTNYNSIPEDSFCCISGILNNATENSCILSSINGDSNISLIVKDGFLTIKYNTDQIYKTDIVAENNGKYTIIMANISQKPDKPKSFKIWTSNKLDITFDYNKMTSYFKNIVLNKEPDTIINYFQEPINAPVYINYDGIDKYCDFTYYAIITGNIQNDDNISLNEYYTSCYGQKQILFNCLKNANHLKIITDDTLEKDFVIRQKDFNYNEKYRNGQYSYYDGNSKIIYHLSKYSNSLKVSNFEFSLDVCKPFLTDDAIIASNFIGYGVTSTISITKDMKLVLVLGDTFISIEDMTFDYNKFYNIKILIDDETLFIYVDNNKISEHNVGEIVGTNKDITFGENSFNGFIKNIYYNIKYSDNTSSILQSNCQTTLRDDINKNNYTNYGVRLITTPQLINDTTNLDLYGNKFAGVR